MRVAFVSPFVIQGGAERHLQLLRGVGVHEVVVALGFRSELVQGELERLAWQPRPQVVLNSGFELGSVLTVHTAADAMTRGGDVLLMDADVLYHRDIMAALVAGPRPVNRLLIDRSFEPGDEPVKICVRGGVPVELRKKVAAELQYDTIGESVGFFRFDEAGARRFAAIVADYVNSGRDNLPHEEAIRDFLREGTQPAEVVDVTGMPWIEIDFPADVERAERDILPRLS